jgi:Nucleoside 2-deoxyribosyltransferase like
MKLVYVPEPIRTSRKAIMLCGPTPRSPEVKSWRPDAVECLKNQGFEGTVYLPENRSGHSKHSYDDQIQWETDALTRADCILFWVPRDLKPDANGYPRMGALTTNVEFGLWCSSGKIVLGFPHGAQKMNYLAWHAEKLKIPMSRSMEATVRLAVARAHA